MWRSVQFIIRALYMLLMNIQHKTLTNVCHPYIYSIPFGCVCLNHYSECLKIGISEEYIVIESGASKCQLEMNIKTWPPLGYDSHINQS